MQKINIKLTSVNMTRIYVQLTSLKTILDDGRTKGKMYKGHLQMSKGLTYPTFDFFNDKGMRVKIGLEIRHWLEVT
jgi:hypothetical protein|tara:strand:- start:2157 stop:2384 length:228 start_codon:yes stop_codon:yes gene_type:complete